jgi:hypothetical protein
VNWDLFDFAAAGTLLLGAGLVYSLVSRNVSAENRAVVGIAVVAVLLLVWAELAVGVLGTPLSGQ